MLGSRSHHLLCKRSEITFKPLSSSLNILLSSTFSTIDGDNKKKVVIVGGVAGGATAAARMSRLTSAYDITVIEKSPDVSFANCGLPYYIGREILDRNRLALQTPQSLSETLGVKVLTNTEVISINREQKMVEMKDVSKRDGNHFLSYDYLILSPGASPIRPPVPGINHPRVLSLRNLQDMDKIDAIVSNRECKEVVVIGAGFIGLEIVEQLQRIGKKVHLVEKASTVLPQADPEMAEFLHGPLVENNIQLHLNDGLAGFSSTSDDSIQVKLESNKVINADLAILCIGVVPNSQLAKEAKLNISNRGFIQVNEVMQTNDPNIYAVGDVIETADLVFPYRKINVALGNIANMQARIAADHIVLGRSIPYRGSLGTSIVRAFENTLALTGWNEKRLQQANIPYSKTTVTGWDHASYYPGALPITMKILFDPVTGKLFGGQAFGPQGVDKRIDVLATAITGGLTIDDLSLTQLTYSPPFGSARDVANIAGLAARNLRDGIVKAAYDWKEDADVRKKVQILDVRPKENAAANPIPNSINVPYKEIRKIDPKFFDKDTEYRTVCAWGKTAYFSSRYLQNIGVPSSTLIGGMTLHAKPRPVLPSPNSGSDSEKGDAHVTSVKTESKTIISVDCTGLSCPGPLLKLKESIDSLPPQSILEVTATDPGFKADVKAFAESNGLILKDLTTKKGVIHAVLSKSDRTLQKEEPHSSSVSNLPSNVRKGATIVVFSEEMDKVLAALVIANGAAAMGGKVTLFFTFWGLNALRDSKSVAHSQKSAIDSMFGMIMPKGRDSLPLSHFNFGGMGAEMMKYVMNQKKLPNLPDLFASAKAQNIRLVACTMSMEAMGITREELVEGIELGGVADYLAASEKSGTNLFI